MQVYKRKKVGRFRGDVEKGLFRVPISITKEMEDWLQGLANEMKASGGYKLPKSYVIRALLNAVMNLDLDVKEVRSEEELQQRFLEAIRRHKKT